MVKPGERLSLAHTLSYAAPGVAIKALTLPLIAYLPPLYASLPGLSLATVGVVFMLARMWDIFTDPIAGAIMDRSRPPLGRRKFWIALATPALMATVWPLFNPPQTANAIHLGGLLFLFYVAWTLLTIAHAAWPADLTPDSGDRTRLIAWREWAGVLGMVAVLAAPILVLGGGAPLEQQLRIMGGLLLLVVPLTILPSLVLLPRLETKEENSKPDLSGAWRLIQESPAMRRLLTSDLLSGCAYAANSATSFFVMSQYLSVGEHYSAIMLCFMLAMILGIPAFLKLSLWKGPQFSFALAMIGAAAASIGFAFAPAGNVLAAMALNAALGFCTGGYQFNLNTEMVRLADNDRQTSGQDRVSLHLALLAMTNKLGYALAVGVVYVLLQSFSEAQGAKVELSPFALVGLGLATPAALFLGAAWTLRANGLRSEKQEVPLKSG
jgi:Na+/melibiose symporter-like transporter